MRIAFFGSSKFSVSFLEKLISAHNSSLLELCSVVTSEDKPANRGYELTQNPISKATLTSNFTGELLKIKTLKNPEIQRHICSQSYDLGVVVSFGYIIPAVIINSFRLGMINFHPGNLPAFRGAAPIQRTIENGDKLMDLNVIKLTPELDAGDILIKKTINIDNLSASYLIPEIAKIGANILLDATLDVQNLLLNATMQVGTPGYAAKIQTEELLLNFSEDIRLLVRKINAFNLDGCCYFMNNGKRIKIIEASFEEINHQWPFGSLENGKIYCKNGVLIPKLIQAEGKKITDRLDILR